MKQKRYKLLGSNKGLYTQEHKIIDSFKFTKFMQIKTKYVNLVNVNSKPCILFIPGYNENNKTSGKKKEK